MLKFYSLADVNSLLNLIPSWLIFLKFYSFRNITLPILILNSSKVSIDKIYAGKLIPSLVTVNISIFNSSEVQDINLKLKLSMERKKRLEFNLFQS